MTYIYCATSRTDGLTTRVLDANFAKFHIYLFTSADYYASERSARLWKAIEQLPDRLRVVIVLTSIEGHGVKEVADLMGVAEGTIKSRMFEARQKLREALQ